MNILIIFIGFTIMGFLFGFTQEGIHNKYNRHRVTVRAQKLDILIDGAAIIIGSASYIYAFISGGIVFGIIAFFSSWLMNAGTMRIGMAFRRRLHNQQSL